jgi:hypothetical protein
VVSMKITVICDVAQCSLVGGYSTRLYGVTSKMTAIFRFLTCLKEAYNFHITSCSVYVKVVV